MSLSNNATGALKHGISKEDVFRGFRVVAKVAERRLLQVHSVQALLRDDGPGSPPSQVNVHRAGANPFGELSVQKEMIIRDCVVAVYPYIISFLCPVNSDMVASAFRGDSRDSASKGPNYGNGI